MTFSLVDVFKLVKQVFFFDKCTCHSLQLSKYFIEKDSGVVRDGGAVCGWMR